MSLLPVIGGFTSAAVLPDVDGLLAHYDAALGVTESGGAVSQWDDQSGNANHLTTPDTDPSLVADQINGLPSIRFNGTSDYMTKTGLSYDEPHFYIVMRSVSHTDGDTILYLSKPGMSFLFRQDGSAGQVNLSGPSAAIANAQASASVGTFFLANGFCNGTSSDFLQINEATAVSSDGGSAPADLTTIAVAADANGTVESNIEVAEMVFYSEAANTPVTGGDDTALKAYFSAKYGVF
jgi:hypothetical protein